TCLDTDLRSVSDLPQRTHAKEVALQVRSACHNGTSVVSRVDTERRLCARDHSAESGAVVAVGPLVPAAGAGWGDGSGVWVGVADTCSARQAAIVSAPRPYRHATNQTRSPIPGISAAARKMPNPAKNAPIRPPVLVLLTIVRPSESEATT